MFVMEGLGGADVGGRGNSPLGVGLPHVAWVFPRNVSKMWRIGA